ncbi:MAG: hypothetical protein OEQ39_21995 [Gammaproteobacteria bacterium]|nr:hypothetical protein [Gammaproteobacteria bacterium]
MPKMPLYVENYQQAIDEYRIATGDREAGFVELITDMGYSRQTAYDWINKGPDSKKLDEITGFIIRLTEQRA